MQRVLRFIWQKDLSISCRLKGKLRHSLLEKAIKLVAYLGDGSVVAIVPMVLVLAGDKFLQKIGFACLLSAFIGFLTAYSIKEKLPFQPQDLPAGLERIGEHWKSNKPMAPCGNTAAAFVLAVFFSTALPFGTILFFLLAGAVGFSRVYLGEHYTSNVLTGAGVGLITGIFVKTVV